MFNNLSGYLKKPSLYAPSTDKFWDDEHISKGMLEAHLNPNWDAATRKPDFLDRSVKWISEIAPPSRFSHLLDLGCGPGLYAERFSKAGYRVTGVDFSKRSIGYAIEQTLMNGSGIEYHYQNYLDIDYAEQFDVVTLIYCDYAVLSIADRHALLKKIHRALRPNGKFIFDVFAPRMRKKEAHSWEYFEAGGFFSAEPHVLLESAYQYDDADQTELAQSIVITENKVDCYNIWDHFFTMETLASEIQPIGFNSSEFFGDIAGREFSDGSETICGVFAKQGQTGQGEH